MKLFNIIEPYSSYRKERSDEETEEKAKMALLSVYIELKKMNVSPKYAMLRDSHILREYYVRHLYELDCFLKNEFFTMACHALYDIIEAGIFQGRYYKPALNILRERLIDNES